MFLDLGSRLINADQITQVDGLKSKKDGSRTTRITLKDGSVRETIMTLEEVKEQLSTYVIPASMDCWLIAAQIDTTDDRTIEIDFRASQIVAFRWSPRWKLMEPIDAIGEVDPTERYGIMQSDGTVRDEHKVYGSAREWKDSVAEEYRAKGKTVRRLDLEPRT